VTEPVSDVEIGDVRPQHRFDEKALDAYLSDSVRGFEGPMTIRQFQGGMSNPTFFLDTPKKRYVMRKKPPGELLKSAHQVDREHRVMQALADTPVPVPEMLCLCMDDDVIGQGFYVMEHVEGRVLIDPAVPSLGNEERTALYEQFTDILAHLHMVDHEAVGLGDFGRPGNYYSRQISRWSKQYVASVTEDIPDMDFLMEWLPANTPEAEEISVVHGDYRIGNCILHPTEPRIVAVLDWELSTLGHGLADVAYVAQEYYGHAASGGFADIDPNTIGIPNENQFLRRYGEITGQGEIENWPFYIAYTMFRSAAIVQGVYRRGLDGNASSDAAKNFAGYAAQRAKWGMDVLRKAGMA
jgi:aminoglycoside phosphotransferase (APT) family kinase protein